MPNRLHIPKGWEKVKLSDIISERSERVGIAPNPLIFSSTKYDGLVPSEEYFKRRVYGMDLENYKVVRRGWFAYATNHLNEGSIGYQSEYDWGAVSPMYTVFEHNERVDAKYLFYVLKSQPLIETYKSLDLGTVNRRGSIRYSSFSKIKINLPPVPEQRRIAGILGSVDDVIERTRAVIEQLKTVKKSIMNKLLTCGIDSRGKIRNPIKHPELFKQSPLGLIPKEWNTVSLKSLAGLITSGSRGWAKYYSEDGPIFLRIANLTREHINLRLDNLIHVNPPNNSEGLRTVVKEGDLLISITADLGIIGVIPRGLPEAYVNQHIALVRINSRDANSRWIGHYLSGKRMEQLFYLLNDAGAKAGLNLQTIASLVIALPRLEEQATIVSFLDLYETRISNEKAKCQQIEQIKLGLMQALLTGKVRVKV